MSAKIRAPSHKTYVRPWCSVLRYLLNHTAVIQMFNELMKSNTIKQTRSKLLENFELSTLNFSFWNTFVSEQLYFYSHVSTWYRMSIYVNHNVFFNVSINLFKELSKKYLFAKRAFSAIIYLQTYIFKIKLLSTWVNKTNTFCGRSLILSQQLQDN